MNALTTYLAAPSVLSTTARIRAASIVARTIDGMTSSQFADAMAAQGFKRSTCVTQYNNAKREENGPSIPKAPRAAKPKKIAVELLRDTSKYATMYGTTPNSRGDKNDCVVRALAVACGIEYDQAHAICEQFGRKFRKGTYDHTIRDAAALLNMSKVQGLKESWDKRQLGTLRQFIAANPVGKFFVVRPRHAFAVIDGVLHDWSSGTTLSSKVRFAYQAA